MAGAIDSFAKGFTVGSAIRERLNQRRMEKAKRQALDTMLSPKEREVTAAIPSEQGYAYKPEEQTIKLPEAITWEQLYKMGIKQGVDPDKWAEFVETNRKKTVEHYFNNALVAFRANPNVAAQSLMKAMAHLNAPVFITPDDQGNLMAFPVDPATGEVASKPYKVDEEYLYKLKKLYQDKYNFGKEAAAAEKDKAVAEYYRQGGKRTQAKPQYKLTPDFYAKYRESVDDYMARLSEGLYGEKVAEEVQDNPAIAPQFTTFAMDFLKAQEPLFNSNKVPPPTAEDAGRIYFGLLYANSEKGKGKDKGGYIGPKVEVKAARVKGRGTAYFASIDGGNTYYVLPMTLVSQFRGTLQRMVGTGQKQGQEEKPKAAQERPKTPQRSALPTPSFGKAGLDAL